MGIERTRLSSEVAELLSHLELKSGHVSFSRDTFLVWRRRMRSVPDARRFQLKVELLAVARRMCRHSVTGAAEAIAQLVALVNDGTRLSPRGWTAAPTARSAVR
jgi:hypothetical protein